MAPIIEPQIPDVVLERLALYHCLLQEWLLIHKNRPITSREIARILGFTDETVRRDLSFLSKSGGKPGVGYDVQELYDILSDKLAMEDRVPVVFVGSLDLIESLSSILNLDKFGFIVEAIFSENPEDVGKVYRGVKVLSLDEIKKENLPEKSRLAVVMTHSNWLNFTMSRLKEAGVKGILNLTPSVVTLFPDGVEGIQLRYPCYLKVLQFKTKSKK
jgi:redox-sensing transcriptional repressor